MHTLNRSLMPRSNSLVFFLDIDARKSTSGVGKQSMRLVVLKVNSMRARSRSLCVMRVLLVSLQAQALD